MRQKSKRVYLLLVLALVVDLAGLLAVSALGAESNEAAVSDKVELERESESTKEENAQMRPIEGQNNSERTKQRNRP
jgi:hypothetical protein